MMRRLFHIIFILLSVSCVEPYQFRIEDTAPALVIEGIITDKSYNESLGFPSDGRFFSIRLTRTGDVINTRPQPVRNATVQLESELESWSYEEKDDGLYELTDPDFKALPGINYRMRIQTEETSYTSDWESLPLTDAPPINAINFTETQKSTYIVEAGETVIRERRGIEANVRVPDNTTGSTVYYKWSFSPTWVYRAPLTSVSDAGHVCWVTSETFLADYVLQAHRIGIYSKELFFIETVRNEIIFERLSVLVSQLTLNEDYFYFLSEMKDQLESGGITGKPPFNLNTNFQSSSGERVIGFFSVANESSSRWYFDRKDLSYNVENTLKADCLVDYNGPPAPPCLDCRTYQSGLPSTTRPEWWND